MLLLLDADDAGEAGTARLGAVGTARRVPLPDGQDVTDFHLAGGDLRALVEPHVWQPGGLRVLTASLRHSH